MSIKRYDCDCYYDRGMYERGEGEYITFKDHAAEVARLNEQVRALAAEVQNCRRFVVEHLGPDSGIEFSHLDNKFAESIMSEIRVQGAIDARNALLVAGDGTDIYAILTGVADRIRKGEQP